MELSCSIKGCKVVNLLLFKFPNPERHHKLFMDWVGATGDVSLLNCHPLEIYYSRRVCQKHFEEKHYRDKSHLKPVPYLHLPEPVTVPSQWIISITKSENIDEEQYESRTAHLESDIIETAGFVKYTYTTVGPRNWFLFRNTFLVAKVDTDEEEERDNYCSLWSVPRSSLKQPRRKKYRKKSYKAGKLKNIGKSVHYLLTSPSEYYSAKFKFLLQMYNKTTDENEKLWKENHLLKRKVRELKKSLFAKHT